MLYMATRDPGWLGYRLPGWDIGQLFERAANHLNYLARPERFELPTPWFVGCTAFVHK